MSIKKIVIHEVQRFVDKGDVKAVYRDSVNDIAALTATLAESLIKLFSNASLSIGGFGVGGDHSVKPAYEQYLDLYKSTSTDDAFLDLTKKMAANFKSIIEEESKLTVKGGFLVFYEYEFRSVEWIAVAILQRTEGLDVNAGLEVIASKLLDLNKLHLGATINLKQWAAGDGERYIKFRTGLAGDLRNYFEKFIGCQRDKEAIKTETKDLQRAIEGYCKNILELSDDDTQNKMDDAYKYISGRLYKSEPVLLTSLASTLFSDHFDSFFDYVKENDISLSEDLAIDRVTLNKFQRITGKWKGINLTFNRKSVGSTVLFENGKIILNEVPQSVIDEIIAEQTSRKTNSKGQA
jgi:nucleoid-associated protein